MTSGTHFGRGDGYHDSYRSSGSSYNKKRGYDDDDDGRDNVKKTRESYPPPPPKFQLPRADHRITAMNRPDAPYMEWIAKGLKKAEGRVNSDFYARYRVGDTLCLHNYREFVLCRIVYLKRYASFKEMLEKEGLRTLLPYARSIDEGVRIYEGFPGSGRVRTLGALSIGVEPLRSYLISDGREINYQKTEEKK